MMAKCVGRGGSPSQVCWQLRAAGESYSWVDVAGTMEHRYVGAGGRCSRAPDGFPTDFAYGKPAGNVGKHEHMTVITL